MTDKAHSDSTSRRVLDSKLANWLPIPVRGLLLLLLGAAGAFKFINYAGEVSNFVGYGVPAPEVTVLIIGFVEVAAALAIALGVAGRLAGFVVSSEMIVAIVLAGPQVTNIAVLLASIAIVVLGTGPYSVWDSDGEIVARMVKRTRATR